MTNRFSKFIASASLLAVAVTLPATAAYADRIDDAIKSRQGFYQMVSFNFGGLIAMAKGDVEYDAEQAKTYAQNMKDLTELNTGLFWIPGSDNEARAGKTRALPGIWQEGSKAGEYAGNLKAAVAEAVDVVGNGRDALGPVVGKIGATCTACHKEYRARSF